MITRERIDATKVQRKKLEGIFKAPRTTVRDALWFNRYSYNARKMRSFAVNFMHCRLKIKKSSLVHSI